VADVDFTPAELAGIRAAFLGEPEPDLNDKLISAIARAGVFGPGPGGHQAGAAERAAAYQRYQALRAGHYGQPPGREQVRNSLAPGAASPMVRRIFGRG
jgi:hypothetical protein